MAVDLTAFIANKANAIFANKIERAAQVEMQVMSRRVGRDFITEAQKYPPENEGNRPPTPYWQRGVGMIRGNGVVSPSSQQLGDNWQLRGIKTPFGGTVSVLNPVTYAPFVHDDIKQARFHGARGWKTMSQIAEAIDVKTANVGPGAYNVTDAPRYLRASLEKIRLFIHNQLNK